MISPFAKPHIVPFKPKPPERLSVGRRMSIIAAFSSSEGMILCADSQETVANYAKRRIDKITFWSRKDAEFYFAIAAAGSSHYADMFTFDLKHSIFDNFTSYDPAGIIEFLQRKLADFYTAHSLPRGDNAPIEFLSVVQPRKGLGLPLLLHLTETAVNVTPHETRCIGIGSYLANYILDHILSPYGSKHHMISVAAYMLKEVRENVEGCGKDSTIYFFSNDGAWEQVSHDFLDRFERQVDEMNAVMVDAFHYATDIENPHNPDQDLTTVANELHGLRDKQEQILKEHRAEARFWANYGKGEKAGAS